MKIGSQHLMLSEFKFGFELEAVFVTDNDYDAEDIVENIIREKFPLQDPETDLDIHEDGSITPINDGYPFEWASPVMSFTPSNILSCSKFLAELNDNDIFTNDSCGFHVHLSFKHLIEKDLIWFLCHLAANPAMADKVTKFEGHCFYDWEYADHEFLVDIAEALVDSNFSLLREIFTGDKYRIFRIHPQGTLEWRGPRGFLDKPCYQKNLKFFRLLRDLLTWLNDSRYKDLVLPEKIWTRDEFMKELEPKLIFSSKDKRWSPDQDPNVIKEIIEKYPWFMKANFEDALVEIDRAGSLIWLSGEWNDGVWESGTWRGGNWRNGIWKNGSWEYGAWYKGVWENGKWWNGYWYGGTWMNGEWYEGYWNNGEWKNGKHRAGVWSDGTWLNGEWLNGRWSRGTWHDGIWLNGYWGSGTWLNGHWHDGKWFEGTWVDGLWKGGARFPDEIAETPEKTTTNKTSESVMYAEKLYYRTRTFDTFDIGYA